MINFFMENCQSKTFKGDYAASVLFQEMANRASTEDCIIDTGKERVQVRKGQVFFTSKAFAEYLNWPIRRVQKILQDLISFYKVVSIRRHGIYTVVDLQGANFGIKEEVCADLTSKLKEPEQENKKKFEPFTPLSYLKDSVLNNNEELQALVNELTNKGFEKDLVLFELKRFIAYWEEKSARGQERWRGEKYFEVKRRLATWFSNIKNKQYKTKPINPIGYL